MSAVGTLWTNAAPWRWLSSAALIATLLVVYLEVTPTYRPASQAQTASYDAAAQRSAAAAATRAAAPATGNAPASAGPSAPPSPPAAAPLASPSDAGARAAESPPGTPAHGGTVTFVKTRHGGEVSGGGLIASYCCAGASSTVVASQSVSTGRHYYEMELRTRKGAARPDTWTSAGIMQAAAGPSEPDADSGVAGAIRVLYRGHPQGVKDGDVFMFAIDMERGYFYYGVNGAWSNAVPGRDAGRPIARVPYIPFVSISASSSHPDRDSDRWVANFGQNPFRYVPPGGFAAYGGGAAPPSVIKPVAPDTAAQPARTGIVGRAYTDTVPLAGMKVPLPDGTWTVVAFQRGGSSRPDLEMAVLANLANKKLGGLVAVSAWSDSRRSGAGAPAASFCSRTDYVAHETRVNDPSGAQECWWVNHATNAWGQNIMRAARADLELRGVTDLPDTLVNVGVWVANPGKLINMLVYFDPRAEGIQTPPGSWEASEWHRTRIASYPDKAQYVKKLESFGRSWVQIVRANL